MGKRNLRKESEETPELKSLRDAGEILKRRISKQDKELTDLRQQINEAQKWTEAMRDAIVALPAPKKLAYKRPKLHHQESTAILNLTDWHAEEYVDPREMEGFASFNWEIFLARTWLTGQKTVELVNIMRQAGAVDKLVVNCLGDMLTGAIHAELDRTNTLDLPVAIPKTGWILAQLVQALSPHFKAVEVHCVCGNHGRQDEKPVYKKKAQRNWDYSVYEIARLFTLNDESVVWDIPVSPSCRYEIPGLAVLVVHGDNIRMQGTKPWYGLARATANEHAKRKGPEDFDVVFQGHLHDFDVVEGRIMCPALIGTNEYAFNALHTYSDPKQLLVFANEKHGLTCYWPIGLNSAKGHEFIQ